MTDVRTRTNTGTTVQKHNTATVAIGISRQSLSHGEDLSYNISGVNGVTDNGPLDTKFEHPRYYNGPTSEEYVDKGY